jgi:predicted Zn-dependent protease
MAGGRIFINTRYILGCESVDELAGVLAHEIGHIIARHVSEKHSVRVPAILIARNIFGWRGQLGTDRKTSRLQEIEADHMGLMIMADAGFDPQARIDYLERRASQLDSDEQIPEFLSTHPSVSLPLASFYTLLKSKSNDHKPKNRLEQALSVLSGAKAMFRTKAHPDLGSVDSKYQKWGY